MILACEVHCGGGTHQGSLPVACSTEDWPVQPHTSGPCCCRHPHRYWRVRCRPRYGPASLAFYALAPRTGYALLPER